MSEIDNMSNAELLKHIGERAAYSIKELDMIFGFTAPEQRQWKIDEKIKPQLVEIIETAAELEKRLNPYAGK